MIEVLRMNKSILNKLAICSILFWLAGCSQNKYTKTIEQLCPPAATRAETMTAAEQVLARMHFDIEKFDVNAGYIRTAPLPGAQSFEFWRKDSVGSFNRSEANLHSIRRAVELTIDEQAGQMCINCKATTQRLSLPQSQNAAGHSHPIMSSGQRSVQKFKLGHEQKSNLTWTDLGRDNQLETEILKRIEKKLAATKKEQNK